MSQNINETNDCNLDSDTPFKILNKLLNIDPYIPPEQFMKICNSYITEDIHNTTYTLEQASTMLYVEYYKETFADFNPISKIKSLVSSGYTYKQARTSVLSGYEVYESVGNFTTKLKNKVSAVFSSLFGGNASFEICKINSSGEEEKSYAIYKDELQFLGYIILNYKSSDFSNFVKGDFNKINPEYLNVMLFGANLVLNHHKINITNDILRKWLNINIECYRQRILNQYNLLHDRINDIFSFKSNKASCIISQLEKIKLCEFLLMNLTDEIDEHIEAIDKSGVTSRTSPDNDLKLNKKKINESKLK